MLTKFIRRDSARAAASAALAVPTSTPKASAYRENPLCTSRC